MNYLKAIYYQWYKKSHPIYILLIHIFLLFVFVGCCLLWNDYFQFPVFIQLPIYVYLFLALHTYIPVVVQFVFENDKLSLLFFFLSPFGYLFSIFCPIILFFYNKKGMLQYD